MFAIYFSKRFVCSSSTYPLLLKKIIIYDSLSKNEEKPSSTCLKKLFLYDNDEDLKLGFQAHTNLPVWPLAATGTTMTVIVTPKKSTQESSSVVDFSSHAIWLKGVVGCCCCCFCYCCSVFITSTYILQCAIQIQKSGMGIWNLNLKVQQVDIPKVPLGLWRDFIFQSTSSFKPKDWMMINNCKIWNIYF